MQLQHKAIKDLSSNTMSTSRQNTPVHSSSGHTNYIPRAALTETNRRTPTSFSGNGTETFPKWEGTDADGYITDS